MSPLVKVIVINSLSFTGTTWLNTVLGSHARAFALGPPDRVWNMRKTAWDTACLIHGRDCNFWPTFHKAYDPRRNFFIQLAESSGSDVIITNNPLPLGAGKELKHPDIEIKTIQLVRDGRAVAASHTRHNRSTTFLDSVTDFLYPPLHQFHFDPDNTDLLSIQYEDVMAAKCEFLQRIGRFIDLDYDNSTFRFWEYEHHLASGNAGFISLIKFGQGIPVSNFPGRQFYEDQFDAMQADSDATFRDERWRDELSRRDLFVFDLLCGPDNERFGYERERFTLSEVATFSEEFERAAKANKINPKFARKLPQLLANQPRAEARPAHNRTSVVPTVSPGLRMQLNLNWLRNHGLILAPRHLKLLLMLGAIVLLVGALAAFLLAWALVT